MSLSVPKFILNAFAKSGLKNAIPESADPVTGDAGYTEGFPAVTMQPKTAGGIPPKGQDFNGVLFDITSAIQYTQSGQEFPFNQLFANAIGGYSKGAVVSDPVDRSITYKSKIDGNLVAPPSPNWEAIAAATQATESVAGIAKIATQAKVNAGTDDFDFVTSKKLRLGVSVLFGESGHVFFPTWLFGGFGFQWGVFTSSSSADVNVLFPLSFTDVCYGVVAQKRTAAGTLDYGSAIISTQSKTGFSFASWIQTGRSGAVPCTYFAWGK